MTFDFTGAIAIKTFLQPQAVAAANSKLSIGRIFAAYDLIDPCFRDSPQFEAESLGVRLGCKLVVKVETLNPIRSFKARGAQFLLSQHDARQPLVCASAGNFGQGMAYAARVHGAKLTVFTNCGANALKVSRMIELGAKVIAIGERPDAALAAAARCARETGARLVEDGRERAISEGAGTIGMELCHLPLAIDDVVLPLGDGGLLSGVGCWMKAYRPKARVIGVCTAGAPAMRLAWDTGQVVTAPSTTIADALSVQTPFAEAVSRIATYASAVLTVKESSLISAMQLAYRELGVVLEPGGAAGLAALLEHPAEFEGRRAAVVLTGGNLTESQAQQWLQS